MVVGRAVREAKGSFDRLSVYDLVLEYCNINKDS